MEYRYCQKCNTKTMGAYCEVCKTDFPLTNEATKPESPVGSAQTPGYEPFGPAWEKEMMKMPKPVLVDMIRRIKSGL